jgi:hypothetical protein
MQYANDFPQPALAEIENCHVVHEDNVVQLGTCHELLGKFCECPLAEFTRIHADYGRQPVYPLPIGKFRREHAAQIRHNAPVAIT